MIIRPRRLRLTQALRDMVRETRLASEMLIYPVFIKEGVNIVEDVPAMPGQKRWSPDRVSELLESVAKLKIIFRLSFKYRHIISVKNKGV